jgi:hypothetical protein
MGIDTNVKIIGKLDVDQLVTFIKKEISESITTSIEEEEQFFDTRSDIVFLGINGIEKRDVGWIHISYNGKNRSIFYLYKDTFWFSPQDIASNIKNGTPELNGLYTYLSLGFDSDAVEIMTKIAKKFGGYIDEQDTDNIPYKKVEID